MKKSDEIIPGRAAISVGDPGTSVPDGWRRVLLTDVARMESGHTPSRTHAEYWNGDVPWVGIVDARINHGRVIQETLQTVTEEGLANSAARWLPARTVCLSRTASVGYATILGRPMVTSQDFVNWVCSDALQPEFLMYALLAEGEHLKRFGKGSTHTTIYFPAALAFCLNLPSVAEQHRVVAKVEALMAEVSATRARLAKVSLILKRFRQSVLAAACSGSLTNDWRIQHPDTLSPRDALRQLAPMTLRHKHDTTEAHGIDVLPDLDEAPETWVVASVADAVTLLQYGTSSKADGAAHTGVPVLRMGNIQEDRLDVTDLKYLSKSEPEFLLEDGDILFNRTNSPELVGKSAVFHGREKMLFASYLIRIRTVQELARPDYLCTWINSPWGKGWARKVRTDGVSQSNINASKIAQMPLPLPPLAEQHEIVRRVDALFALADSIERRLAVAIARTDKLPQAILAKAFRGELVPTEAELARAEGRDYEPASALLERIRTEREAAGPTASRGRKKAASDKAPAKDKRARAGSARSPSS
jgi:type I restriction enzyme S subunit